MGLNRNIGYQFGKGFVTLWAFILLKMGHVVYIHMGMYVSVNSRLYNSF